MGNMQILMNRALKGVRHGWVPPQRINFTRARMAAQGFEGSFKEYKGKYESVRLKTLYERKDLQGKLCQEGNEKVFAPRIAGGYGVLIGDRLYLNVPKGRSIKTLSIRWGELPLKVRKDWERGLRMGMHINTTSFFGSIIKAKEVRTQ